MKTIKISKYQNFKSKPRTVGLWDWLKECRDGNEYANQVLDYRLNGDPTMKKNLPGVTVGALCKGGRKKADIKTRTGWIALDIDGKDNPHIDANDLRDQLGNIQEVVFSGLSVSGKGVWVLVKVKHPTKLREHFESLKADFQWLGIQLDRTKGMNANDFRFYSYDPQAIIKSEYRIYEKLKAIPERTTKVSTKKTQTLVENLIRQIQVIEIDITSQYENWLKIGFALADEFGEEGRQYFHDVSRYHPDYDESKTDRKFDSCLESNGKGVYIASFFHICSQYGVTTHSPLNDFSEGYINPLSNDLESPTGKNTKEKANGIHDM